MSSYQVPKEVGKIGNESPTFIEPVATRKDGIQAMFAKQKQKATESSTFSHSQDLSHDLESSNQVLKSSSQQSESTSSSPTKGKRARSPIPIDLSQDDNDEIQVISEPKAKRPKAIPSSPPPVNKAPKVDLIQNICLSSEWTLIFWKSPQASKGKNKPARASGSPKVSRFSTTYPAVYRDPRLKIL